MKPFSSRILLIAVIALLLSCSNNKTTKEEPAAKEPAAAAAPTSTITEKHVQIPNSPLYIIPPPGFAVNTTTMQLAKDYANFMRMKIISGYTPETYFGSLKTEADKKYPGTWKEDAIMAGGHKAVIYTYSMGAIIQYYLAFTDGTTDEMILATVETTDAATGQAMYEALKTVVYKP